jgi:O-antigen/teichoic acid export membrane protein
MSLKKNVIANFAGSAWSALMGLAFVPAYIRLMGVESYGIVGVYASLIGMLAVLDLGLSQAMNREMARLSSDANNNRHKADTARTLELVYWGVAIVVGGTVALLARPIANYWLNPEQITRGDLQQALWIMGLVIALRWPVSLYTGGLNGLQRQVQVNILQSVIATVQGAGALLVLWLVAPTIQAFFIWQAAMALTQVIVLRAALWRSLPSREGAAFNKAMLRNIWRFAAGMSGISLLATILTQVDKAILSKILTLTEFGYYTFAATIAAVLFRMVGPIFTAYYPRMTELVSKNDQTGLAKTYHQGSQLMAVVIFPIALVIALFSQEILEVWTRNPDMVLHASLLISLLTIGNALNGLMNMPYALQLAHGWVKLAMYQNVVAVILLVPIIYFATVRWGAVGAAAVWIILNSCYLLISVQIMHKYLLPSEKWKWYKNDVLKFLIPTLGICAIARIIFPGNVSAIAATIILVFVLILALIAAIMSATTLRNKLLPRYLFRNEV